MTRLQSFSVDMTAHFAATTALRLRAGHFEFRRRRMVRDNDQIDRRLVALLQENARESVATLARKLGVARTTIQERISRLQRNGTIRGYSVVLGRDPFDQYADAIAFLKTSHRKQKDVITILRDFPEISSCHSLSDEYDLMCRMRVIQLEDMLPVLEALAEIPGVESVKSMIILATNFDHGNVQSISNQYRQMAAVAKGEFG
jgi:DNA-binding Lrp family transcriptional regulator